MEKNMEMNAGRDLEKEVIDDFNRGLDCGQVILNRFADNIGIDKAFARKIGSPLGAGMFSGDKCGAVTGAYIVLGIKYGHSMPGETEKKEQLVAKIKEFDTMWEEFNDSEQCKEMLGYDLQDESQMKEAADKGVFVDFCPKAVANSIKILEKIL